jgi:osmotically-inducible protein OsmY
MRVLTFFGFGRIAVLSLALLWLAPACRTTQSPEQQVDDAAITTKVKSKLASDVRLATVTNVDVNTTNGVVTLAGQVRDPGEKHAVESAAKTVPGVRDVNNNLQVAPPENPYK